VLLTLVPKSQGAGFAATLDWRAEERASWQRLLDRADVPFAAPAAVRVGVAATTGVAKNIHEIRHLMVRRLAPPRVDVSFEPKAVRRGSGSTVVLRLASSNNAPAKLAKPLVLQLPSGVRMAQPSRLGGTCPGTVRVDQAANALTVEEDLTIRPTGCTVTVEVHATAAGDWAATIGAGQLTTEVGSNLQPAGASLAVTP
jgi:hypothetical protein